MALRIQGTLPGAPAISPVPARAPSQGPARDNTSARAGVSNDDSFQTRLQDALASVRPPPMAPVLTPRQARSMAQVLDLAVGDSRAILESVDSAAASTPIQPGAPFAALARALADWIDKTSRQPQHVSPPPEIAELAASLLETSHPGGPPELVAAARRLASAVLSKQPVSPDTLELSQRFRSSWSAELEKLDSQLQRLSPRASPRGVRGQASQVAAAGTFELALRLADAAAAIPSAWEERMKQSSDAAVRVTRIISSGDGAAVAAQANLEPLGVLQLLR